MPLIKLVTEQEWDSIHAVICEGENIPRIEANDYEITTWLDKSSCFDSVHGYYIPKDHVTEKYTSGFEEVDLTEGMNFDKI